jgi:hypothetical protein
MFEPILRSFAVRLGGACLAAAALLAGCGGGGSSTSSPTEQPTSYTEGVITGFGSVIVNGIRFDDSAATVSDDDGAADQGRGDLRIGMVVEVEGADVDRVRGIGRALRIRWANEFVGPVSSVDATANSFVLFGQTIEVRPSTVFDDSLPGGLADLKADDIVEVHGLFNAALGRYVATRVELAPSAAFFKLRGIVSDLDTTAKTFKLGIETIYYGDVPAADVPPGLADGLRVRVRLQTAQNNAGQWVAVTVRHGIRKLLERLDSEIEGMVTELTSPTSFSINGIPVDASTAFFRDGPVALGDRVEARGEVVDGTLKALVVKKEDDSADDRNELHGTIASVDTAAKTFVLRHEVHGDITVSYAHVLRYKDGNAADLVAGARVEVKGRLMLGGELQAVEVDFEN